MEEITFNTYILRKNIYLVAFNIYVISSVICLVILGLFFNDFFNRVQGQILGIFLDIFIFSGLLLAFVFLLIFPQAKFLKQITFSGDIKFTDNFFQVNELRVYYRNCQMISIYYAGYDGLREGRHPLSGEGNFIEVALKDGTKRFLFYLESEYEAEKLRKLLMHLYELKLNIEENTYKGKTWGFKDLSYKEIQDFKERYRPN